MSLRAFDHLGLKLISLTLGFALWYVVAGGQGAEIVFPIRLEYRNVPEGLEVIEESVQQAEVRLRGSSEVLRRLSPQDIEVGIDLSEAQPGDRNVYLTPDLVSVPFGVRVMRVAPGVVRLQLDRSARRRVQVVPRVVGSPAEGYELADIWLGAKEIEVTGPASRLADLEQITTEPISVEGLREPYTRTAHFLLEDPYVRLVEAQGVEVTLDVREKRIQRSLAAVALVPLPDTVRVRFSPSSVRVDIAGPISLVEPLRAEDLQAQVAVDGLAPGTHRIRPTIRFLREGLAVLDIVSVKPEEVRARILAPG